MNRFLSGTIVVFGCAAIAGPAVWGLMQAHSETKLGDDDADTPARSAALITHPDGTPTLTLDKAVFARREVTTLALKDVSTPVMHRAYGTVLDLQGLTDLSNKYATAQANLQTQQAKQALARATFERAKALYTGGPRAVSKAQLETAEETVRIDAAGVAAAEAQLRAITNTTIQSWGPVLARGLGQASSLVSKLVDRQDMLIQITLDADAKVAKAPKHAFIKRADGRHIDLRFVSAAAKMDPLIQGQSFYYTAPATSGLVPGMNVVASVPTGEIVSLTKVPASAIVWLQGRSWAYFRTGPKTLVRRAIATNFPAPGGGYFVKNLPDNAQVVIHGAQMLLSEEFRSQIQEEE